MQGQRILQRFDAPARASWSADDDRVLYPHPFHQRLYVTPPDLAPLGNHQASQHSRAGEGKSRFSRTSEFFGLLPVAGGLFER
jgi:hypothetical protein